MNESRRHKLILQHLQKQQVISTQEVMSLLDISLSTARRDIHKMDQDGLLRKIRNGAESLENNKSTPDGIVMPGYPIEHLTENYHEKLRIAKQASQLCKDGDSVIINGSNTTCLMAEFLTGRDLQVITNYLPLSCYLITQGQPNLVILGGQYISERYITVSTEEELNLYSGRYVFVSGSGLTEHGLHTSDLLVIMAQKEILKRGDKIVALIDSTKVGVSGGRVLAEARNIDILITGKDADPEVILNLKQQGAEVYLV